MSDARTHDVLRKLTSGDALSPAEEMLARELSPRLGFVKADSGDMMIAWYPPPALAQALAIKGGEAPEDLHVTIVFIPSDCCANPDLVKAVTLVCCQQVSALEGEISGVGRFVLDGDEDAFFLTIDVPGLDDLRRRLLNDLAEAGVYVPQRHGFTPHMTLKYMPRAEESPGTLVFKLPIVIDTLTHAVRDGERTTYDMWTWEDDVDTDPREIARSRPEDPEAASRYDHTVKSGMEACKACGSPMLEKDGNAVCMKCEKSTTKAILPEGLTYAAVPLKKGAEGREWQYTLGPLYAPGIPDAHDEYADDEDLHRAVIQYSLNNDRRVKLQHDPSREVGTWVELMRWPYDHTITITRPGEEPREVDLPAGTVYMGILWDDDAWAAVKDGRLGGLSLGGRAVRVDAGESVGVNDAGS